jgi:hypothetical protein
LDPRAIEGMTIQEVRELLIEEYCYLP